MTCRRPTQKNNLDLENPYWRGRLSTIELIKINCFVKNKISERKAADLSYEVQGGQPYWSFPFSKNSLVHLTTHRIQVDVSSGRNVKSSEGHVLLGVPGHLSTIWPDPIIWNLYFGLNFNRLTDEHEANCEVKVNYKNRNKVYHHIKYLNYNTVQSYFVNCDFI